MLAAHNINKIQDLSHPNYRLLAYNDYLIQHNQSPPPTSINNLVSTPDSTSRIKTNIHQSLTLSHQKNYILFDQYYRSAIKFPQHPILYRWILPTRYWYKRYAHGLSNLDELNVTYHGSLQYIPSSVKAEIMAILTALITAPFGGLITINTDSQAAIDAYHKSANLSSISPQRYNKTNNNTLWTSIHHIILTLKL
ncbi:hypothetical protein RhiirA5_411308 [Rhizophagus irregularis]|uniref:Uncharacterized protein n=2 Tax=Rhizophagus irregularis TaxID=588596 RepID=U9U6X4_RHIID|nr:hypothetical protein GLOIN_2v30539 [Rhizophagus irregularis DAOM 181602=DAOM 197198]PKC12851.1 hypothetical protein RhiirA5_411308 [Rhizophagus irregularis]POG71994.1 hypothetical protein GLOIN_2v30539 [Rhizophagus irregularis DAOM 181602=DAOM 197198]GBC11331.1 ribonuclease H-like domain-containing protein [Rhizophagus irregularis DAOM 181602=DAOM 197198]CAB5095956.1 unnamed protein product [Rhizophagus irregularis]|eukprot:XP_025178860.1 hypothetical protein GLOIN_2v30539 [Rhizophagus irregularis DAOM 181602=DAOM 197198]